MSESRADAHTTDDQISSLLDRRLGAQERGAVEAHLATCSMCADRASHARTVLDMLRALPSVPPPRDFRLTDADRRLVAVPDPPNVVRLRRLYTLTRVGAATMAAAFVTLSAATLFVDTRPPATITRAAQSASGPGATIEARPAADSAPSPAPAAPQVPAVAPLSRNVAQPPAQAGKAPQDADAGDQHAATTTVGPLPTPIPTPVALPTRVPVAADVPRATDAVDDTPWRIGAAICAVLGIAALGGAVAVRRRLTRLHTPI